MSEYCEVFPDFYSVTEHVARITHKCCECRAPIPVGERYVYCTGKWEGELRVYKQHVLCAETCRFFRDKLNGGDCLPFGGLFEDGMEWLRGTFNPRADKKRPEVAQWRAMIAGIKRRQKPFLVRRVDGRKI